MRAVTAASDELPTTTLLWVRHGEAESNRDGRFGGHSPVPLTELGRRQAEAAAAAIAPLAPTAIVASDLVRAHQTAQPIAAACGLDLALDPALRERSLGILDGLGFKEAEQLHPDAWRRLTAREPGPAAEGAETEDEVYLRVATAIDALTDAHRGGTVVVVSHGLALFHAFCHIAGLGSPSKGHTVFVLVDNCSISRVDHRPTRDGKRRWRIHALNDTRHLAGVAR
jgi:broad specificity phosphatase PhoE